MEGKNSLVDDFLSGGGVIGGNQNNNNNNNNQNRHPMPINAAGSLGNAQYLHNNNNQNNQNNNNNNQDGQADIARAFTLHQRLFQLMGEAQSIIAQLQEMGVLPRNNNNNSNGNNSNENEALLSWLKLIVGSSAPGNNNNNNNNNQNNNNNNHGASSSSPPPSNNNNNNNNNTDNNNNNMNNMFSTTAVNNNNQNNNNNNNKQRDGNSPVSMDDVWGMPPPTNTNNNNNNKNNNNNYTKERASPPALSSENKDNNKDNNNDAAKDAALVNQQESNAVLNRGHVLAFVEFKRGRMRKYASDLKEVILSPGQYVLVDGDRGTDCGLLVQTISRNPETGEPHIVLMDECNVRDEKLKLENGKVLRLANNEDIDKLHNVIAKAEAVALKTCRQRCMELGIDIDLLDVEYQFDMKKISFFFNCEHSVDFRSLVRELYRTFGARIWMENINPNVKNSMPGEGGNNNDNNNNERDYNNNNHHNNNNNRGGNNNNYRGGGGGGRGGNNHGNNNNNNSRNNRRH